MDLPHDSSRMFIVDGRTKRPPFAKFETVTYEESSAAHVSHLMHALRKSLIALTECGMILRQSPLRVCGETLEKHILRILIIVGDSFYVKKVTLAIIPAMP